ncbi:bifunctional sulfate adenylyltransferase/adenylylsulfate kinase [Thiospirillum jenense]|uniref:Adenylyl-sulfate kinase n=1 Tax=Thiospirillum jenense TaxID=1653858 RepID=A0A839HKP5_9GAMM|nr:bifunctional sulfate adenylyltransferase/adenylylsulfate kinase [Thiospirillum jenense]MBB1127019.1 bifunctional sulfate adenylyltransferase/adenylylsulfate kinase [Thiospirillum jenense]
MISHETTPCTAPRTLLVNAERAEELRRTSLAFMSLTLTKRQLCDLELLLNGGFYPLTGFMDRATYTAVLTRCQLPTGHVWPMPIVLDVTADISEKLRIGQQVALRDTEGFMPAVLTVTELWQADKTNEAEAIFGTTSEQHPGVSYLQQQTHSYYVAGTLEGIQLPTHYEFEQLWHTPAELRVLFNKKGWRQVLAVHSSSPLHQTQRHMLIDAAQREQLPLLIRPAVGETSPGDLSHIARVQCYQALLPHLPANLTQLALLPLAMRMAGPREALWHTIIQRNYGCSHFLIGPDHASPPFNHHQMRFYEPNAAQTFVQQYADEIGIHIVAMPEYCYVPARATFLPLPEIEREGFDSVTMSEAELKQRLQQELTIPDWVSYPDILNRLRKVYPPRSRQGMTLFFTGLSGSGKSTLANILVAKLTEMGDRPVSLLDGDIVRQNLSSELGFSKAHRDLNIRRIGFVASEITKNGGVAICAPIAPYQTTRLAVRELIEQHGVFIEIHVSTPLEVCEQRDRKGLYAKARQGLIPEFTGISDPYEVPVQPELRIDTSQLSPSEAVQEILLHLFKTGLLR